MIQAPLHATIVAMLKLAFSTLACPRWSIDEVAAAAKAYGYAGVELRLLDGRLIDSSLPRADRRRVQATLERAGVAIVAVDTSVRVAADPDPDEASRELSRMVELAGEWNARVIRVFGGDWGPDRTRAQAVAQARNILGEVVAAAEGNEVAIALETHDRFSRPAIVADVLHGLPSAAAALWDLAHPYREGDDATTVLRSLSGRIAHVHVKDARRSAARPDGWELTLLGEGEVPARNCVDALIATGYKGWFSVEWEKHWHPELAEPEIALPQFAAMLRSWGEDA